MAVTLLVEVPILLQPEMSVHLAALN